MDYCSDFRYDLEVGQVAEAGLADIFENKKVEVKRDLKSKETGNIFIEYQSRGKPSGLATTESDFYCFVIEDLYIILPTIKEPVIAADPLLCPVILNVSNPALKPALEVV